MKNSFKKINLLAGAVAVVGVGFMANEKSQASENKKIEYCDFIDHPIFPSCLAPLTTVTCICDWC